MIRRDLLALLALGVAGTPFASLAQKRDGPRRVGIVWGASRLAVKTYEEAFLAGMKEYGHEVGRNLIVDSRYADGDSARYLPLVAEVIALKPDALLGANTGVAIEMKRKTSTIPIVTGTTPDPVGAGLAQSLARPGNNVTGIALQLHELGAKQIELMAEALPRMRRHASPISAMSSVLIAEAIAEAARMPATRAGAAASTHATPAMAKVKVKPTFSKP